MIQSYKDLEVYRKSYNAALLIHRMTLEFPEETLFEQTYDTYDHIGRQLYRLIENWK